MYVTKSVISDTSELDELQFEVEKGRKVIIINTKSKSYEKLKARLYREISKFLIGKKFDAMPYSTLQDLANIASQIQQAEDFEDSLIELDSRAGWHILIFNLLKDLDSDIVTIN